MLESIDDLNIKRMKIESPEIPEERWFDVGRDITPEVTKDMTERLTKYRNDKDWWHFAYLASDMRTLGLPVELTPEDTKGMAEELSEYRNNKAWWNFAYHASHMRTLGLPVELTPEDTKGMAERLTKDRNDKAWWSFAYYASRMRILAAEEVKMGGARGIEITDKKPKPKIAGEKPMPVRRKF